MPYLLKNSGWFLHFLSRATATKTAETVRVLNSLIQPALDEHKLLLQEAGISNRLRQNGWLKLYRAETSFNNGLYERQILTEHGVAFEELNPMQIGELEPNLKTIFCKGLWITDTASVDNPGKVVAAYADLFAKLGGHIIHDSVTAIDKNRDKDADGFIVRGEQNSYRFSQVVSALGPWSNDLLKSLDSNFPLCYERGYHQHFHPQGEATLSRPYFDVDASYVMTPTDQGLRVTTGTELTDRDALPRPSQLTQVLPKVAEAYPLGTACHSDVWCGSRPTLPDAIPVIGELPGHKGLWLAFGHQHIGFSTGPVTGKMIAEMIAGDKPCVDPRPFSPGRFIRV